MLSAAGGVGTASVEGGSGLSRVTNASILNVDATSVTLRWTATDSATKFKLTYVDASKNVTFIPVSPPAGYSTDRAHRSGRVSTMSVADVCTSAVAP